MLRGHRLPTWLLLASAAACPSSAGAWTFETGWYGLASSQRANATEPGKLSTLPESQIVRSTTTAQEAYRSGGGAVSISNATAFGGLRLLQSGEQVPVIRASAAVTHVGPDDRDGFSRAASSFNLYDTFEVVSQTLPTGTVVTLPFSLMLNGSLSNPQSDLGGDLFFVKTKGGFADSKIFSALQVITRETTPQTLLNLRIDRSAFDGSKCTPGITCSVILDPGPNPGAAEECFPNGCFVVGPPLTSRAGTFLVRSAIQAKVGDRLDLFASGGAEIFTESPRFGNMVAEMSNSAYFGVTELPVGVTLESDLGYGYALDPLQVASVPEPSTVALMGCGLAALALHRRRCAVAETGSTSPS